MITFGYYDREIDAYLSEACLDDLVKTMQKHGYPYFELDFVTITFYAQEP